MVQVLVDALKSQTWPNCGSIEKFSTFSCVVYGPFLEGSDNLTGPQCCSVLILKFWLKNIASGPLTELSRNRPLDPYQMCAWDASRVYYSYICCFMFIFRKHEN